MSIFLIPNALLRVLRDYYSPVSTERRCILYSDLLASIIGSLSCIFSPVNLNSLQNRILGEMGQIQEEVNVIQRNLPQREIKQTVIRLWKRLEGVVRLTSGTSLFESNKVRECYFPLVISLNSITAAPNIAEDPRIPLLRSTVRRLGHL